MAMHARDTNGTAEDAMDQVARLREQVETLMREKVAPAIEGAAEKMEEAAHDAADILRVRADALAGAVREQPLTAILIAAAVGYLLGRAGR